MFNRVCGSNNTGFNSNVFFFLYLRVALNLHQQLLCDRCVERPTFARSDDLLLLVHVVFVALDVAAPALQSGGGFEHVPQRLGARLTVGGEVVEGGDELVALVADVAGLLSAGQRVLGLLFALALVGIKNLERGTGILRMFDSFSTKKKEIHRSQTWNILGISLASARYTSV